MTCTSSTDFSQWSNQVPISFTEWKSILSNLTNPGTSKLSLSSDRPRRTATQAKKPDRQSLPRNQVFGDTVIDSFLVSSSSNLFPSSIGVTRQDVPKILAPPSKRFVSSFKTFVSSTNAKQTQRLNYINDSVVIFKLSKDHATATAAIAASSQLSSKHSTLSMATASTIMSIKPTPLQMQQQLPPAQTLISQLKVEGQKRRTTHHDSLPVIASSTIDSPPITNSANPMATSTTTQPPINPSVFTYRSAAAGGNTVRQRAIAETTSNSLLISAERFKSNPSSSMRSMRQPLTTTTAAPSTFSSTYIPSQQPQRNNNQNTKSRVQQEKSTNSRESYDYPDPFTNCPQDVLSKLAQLTKLQLETIDWEKKKRFTKKKPIANGNVQGKDSP